MKEARATKRAYDADIRGLMDQHGVKTEYEVVSGFLVNAVVHAEQKELDERRRAVSEAMAVIRRILLPMLRAREAMTLTIT